MEDKVFDIRKLERKAKRREWFEKKIKQTKDWCSDNTELLMTVVPSGIGLLSLGIRMMGRRNAARRVQKEKDLRVWDPSLGQWLDLKRKLSNGEKIAYDYRIKNGGRRIDILYKMGVLK